MCSRFGGYNGSYHAVKFRFDLFGEVGLHLEYIGELGKGPATVLLEVVHAGHPVGVHGGFFLLGVFAAIALDLDNELKQVILAAAVAHQHDEIGNVLRISEP